jgi:hypothetical protein
MYNLPHTFIPSAYKIQAPTAPTTARTAPDPTLAPAAGDCVADEAAEAFAATPLPDRDAVLEGAGLVDGSATPLGQCQWLPWGSHVEAVTAWSWSSSSSWE